MFRGELLGFLAKQLVPELQTSGTLLSCNSYRYVLSCGAASVARQNMKMGATYLRENDGQAVRR